MEQAEAVEEGLRTLARVIARDWAARYVKTANASSHKDQTSILPMDDVKAVEGATVP